MNKMKTLLTTLIVLTITAIAVVGFILAWDIFDFSGRLDRFFNTDFLNGEEPLYRSDIDIQISSSMSAGVPDAERAVIEGFFLRYFASLGSFYREDISDYFVRQCEDELIDGLALDCEISAAKSSEIDLSYSECNIRYTVLERTTDRDGSIKLSVRCLILFNYEGLSVQTQQEEEHSFVLKTEEKELLIKKHSSDRPARLSAVAALDKVLAEDGFTQSDMAYTYYSPYIKRAAENFSANCEELRQKISQDGMNEQLFEAEYDYNREAASEYAENSSGNSAKFGSYDENDVNFCSQCLFAGGIPMDAQGDKLTQWKWYDYTENNARENSGCTLSWYDRGRFWTYATENTGFGLVAQVSEAAQIGDIVQLMNGEEPVLQVIVSRIGYNESGTPAEYFVCTDKQKNLPLSLLGADSVRIVSIIGYNTANI